MDFPVLPQEVQLINHQLAEHFGIDTTSTDPLWRVSWSNDQYEKRLTDFANGVQFIHPQVLTLPKYTWIKNRWILERLTLVPEVNKAELVGINQSYEVMWTFEDRHGDALPPRFDACKFVIDTVYAALGKRSMAKYIDEEAKNPVEHKEKRIQALMEDLFGNESPAHGSSGVGFTGAPTINQSKE